MAKENQQKKKEKKKLSTILGTNTHGLTHRCQSDDNGNS